MMDPLQVVGPPPLLTSLLGCVAFATQLLSGHPSLGYAVPPEKLNPVPLRIFGEYTFLTTQTNVFGTVYFFLCLVSWFFPGIPGFAGLSSALFPMAFGLGVFLTLAYYALDHFNEESERQRRHWTKRGYPHCNIIAHLSHMFALPVVFLHAISIDEPCLYADVRYAAMYIAGYVVFSVWNRKMTGAWQYPILADVEAKYGGVGVLIFMAVLAGIVALLSVLGVYITKFGSASVR